MRRRWSPTRLWAGLAAFALLLGLVAVQAAPAAAAQATFDNRSPISERPLGSSTISVTGFATGLQALTVTTYSADESASLTLLGPDPSQRYSFTISEGNNTTPIPVGSTLGTNLNGLWTLQVISATNNTDSETASIRGGWSLTIVSQPVPTATQLDVVPNPSVYGTASYTLTATVRSTGVAIQPTGVVDFSLTANSTGYLVYLGNAALVQSGNPADRSVATYTFNASSPYNPIYLSPGSYTVTASFRGNGDFAPSSTTSTLVINKAATSVTNVTTNPASFQYGTNSINFSALVSNVSNGASLTGGTVTFSLVNGSSAVVCTSSAVAVPTNGSAVTVTGSCTPPDTLVAGSYTAQATYSGDSNFLGSTGSGVTGGTTVTKADVVLAIIPPNQGNPETEGQPIAYYCGTTPVTLSATLDSTNGARFGLGAGQNGAVTFIVRSANGEVGRLVVQVPNGSGFQTVSGTLNLPSSVTAGTYTVTASYSGSAQFNAATAPDSTLTISKADTATAISPANISATYGDSGVTLRAAVTRAQGQGTGAINSGTVTFTVFKGNRPGDTNSVATVIGNVVNNVATVTLPLAGINAGNYTFTAAYSGDECYNPSVINPEGVGTLKVAKRLLILKPVDQTRTSTQTNPGCSGYANIELYRESNGQAPAGSGLVNGDTLQSATTLSSGFSCTYNVSNGSTARPSAPGTYTISMNAVLSANYDIRYKPGKLTVTR